MSGIFGSSAPAAPDYSAVAKEQAGASKELTAQQNWANRPTQETPWGSIDWSTQSVIDPGTGLPVTKWTQTQSLDPKLEGALEQQLDLQNQRSGMAGSFMSRVQSDMGNQPFDWANINYRTPMGMVVNPNPYMTPTHDWMMAKTDVPQTALNTAGPTTRQLNTQGPQQYTNPYQQLGVTGQDTQGLAQTTQTTNAPAFSADRQRIEESLYQRMAPVHQSQQAQMQTQLANQGITPGSEAYKQQMQTLMDNQARERFNAVQQGGQEQQNMQNMLLGQQQQAFGQGQASQQARNQALQNLFGQQQGSGQYGLSAQQQAYQQALQSGQFSNEALQQMFGQDVAATSAANAARQSQFQQGMSSAELYNRAMAQQFSQGISANAQNFQQTISSQQYTNQLRQQAIAEEAARRNMSLNEMNALLTGQQVQSPAMPGFNPNVSSAAPDLLKAAGMTGQAQQDAANSSAQSSQGMMSGLMGLGSTAAMM